MSFSSFFNTGMAHIHIHLIVWTGIFVITDSSEPDGAVVPVCTDFTLGGAGGLPVLGSSRVTERILGSLVLGSDGMVLPALETQLPAKFTGMGSQVSPPARLGSSFLNTAGMVPGGFGGGC